MLATDEEVMQLAAEEYPETAFPGSGRLLAAWRMLWRTGVLTDAQIEARWGLEQLQGFMRELAQAKAMSDSQRFLQEELNATQVDRETGIVQGQNDCEGGIVEDAVEIPPGQPDHDILRSLNMERAVLGEGPREEGRAELETQGEGTQNLEPLGALRPPSSDQQEGMAPLSTPAALPASEAARGCSDGSLRAAGHDSEPAEQRELE